MDQSSLFPFFSISSFIASPERTGRREGWQSSFHFFSSLIHYLPSYALSHPIISFPYLYLFLLSISHSSISLPTSLTSYLHCLEVDHHSFFLFIPILVNMLGFLEGNNENEKEGNGKGRNVIHHPSSAINLDREDGKMNEEEKKRNTRRKWKRDQIISHSIHFLPHSFLHRTFPFYSSYVLSEMNEWENGSFILHHFPTLCSQSYLVLACN